MISSAAGLIRAPSHLLKYFELSQRVKSLIFPQNAAKNIYFYFYFQTQSGKLESNETSPGKGEGDSCSNRSCCESFSQFLGTNFDAGICRVNISQTKRIIIAKYFCKKISNLSFSELLKLAKYCFAAVPFAGK